VVRIDFVPRIDDAQYGVAEQVSPLIRRVIAENPSKFTYRGTGTYIVGHGNVAVIDPGPRLDSHREAIQRAVSGEHVGAIVVTHCHSDHSPLAHWLHELTGAPMFAIGPHADRVVDEPEDDSEEAIDREFVPTRKVVDADVIIDTGEFTLTAVSTPGHTSNHMCVALDQERALFSGDHVMGWSTTVVSPPDGDMRAYIGSLRKVQQRDDGILWPTHGGPVTNPQAYLAQYLQHRLDREEQILRCLADSVTTIAGMVAILYSDVRVELHDAAGSSVLSHLIKLIGDGRVVVADESSPRRTATFALTR
jgi:glyoxylase-like metal-dependent hydrolase (beta-lactamase superfamily II)